MRTSLLWVACCCAVLTACGGSTPAGPSKVPTLSRTRFLAFGDSLTAGEVTVPVASIVVGGAVGTPSHTLVVVTSASYPSVLHGQLVARYPQQSASITMTNSGQPGETLVEGAVRFREVLAETRPEVVLLMEGVGRLALMGPDYSTELARDMVQAAKTQGARVLLGSMLPTIAGRSQSQPVGDLVAFNSHLQAMAALEGVAFVDLYNALLPEVAAVIGIDGLHPTEAGYRRIAEIFFAAIQANLEVK